LHPRNKHRERYDFNQLIESCPDLATYVFQNAYKDESIDFFNPEAVKMLNKALLKHFYNIDYWDIPPNYLCPPIPGRADYIHYAADILADLNKGSAPTGNKIKMLDIGTGANCVYPIIGKREYGWSFVGTDIDRLAIASATAIIDKNSGLKDSVELRLQHNRRDIFNGIIHKNEQFDLSICNPPFHASAEEAKTGAIRKLNNLTGKKNNAPTLNFGGQQAELWCEGGEERFVKDMISQSKTFASSCFWFSSLISKQSNLQSAYNALKRTGAVEVKTIPMGQGTKTSRIIAWTFFTPEQQKNWIMMRWK